LLNPEERGTTLLRNVNIYLPADAAEHRRKLNLPNSSCSFGEQQKPINTLWEKRKDFHINVVDFTLPETGLMKNSVSFILFNFLFRNNGAAKSHTVD